MSAIADKALDKTVKRIFTVTIDEFIARDEPIDADTIQRVLWKSQSFCDVDKVEVVERNERSRRQVHHGRRPQR